MWRVWHWLFGWEYVVVRSTVVIIRSWTEVNDHICRVRVDGEGKPFVKKQRVGYLFSKLATTDDEPGWYQMSGALDMWRPLTAGAAPPKEQIVTETPPVLRAVN